MLASLADAAGLLAGQGVSCQRVLLIGGGSKSEAIRRLAPGVFGIQTLVPESAEYVALGAARQAAWAVAGTSEPPAWSPQQPAAEYAGAAEPQVLRLHLALRADTAAWPAR